MGLLTTIQTNAGFTVDSARPRRKRLVAMPANEVHAGVVIRMTPHAMVVRDTNFPIGSRWSRYDEGNCPSR
jgi:hypothetical protein